MAVVGSGWQARRNENMTLSYVRSCFDFDFLQDYMHAHGLDLKQAAVVKEIPFLPHPLSNILQLVCISSHPFIEIILRLS
jgi:hypothetical protein